MGCGYNAGRSPSAASSTPSTSLPSRLVGSDAVQEVAVDGPDLALLPHPPFLRAGKRGPYLAAGAIIAEDSASKARNLSFAR